MTMMENNTMPRGHKIKLARANSIQPYDVVSTLPRDTNTTLSRANSTSSRDTNLTFISRDTNPTLSRANSILSNDTNSTLSRANSTLSCANSTLSRDKKSSWKIWKPLTRKISRTKSLSIPDHPAPAMSACMPVNNVGDVNANVKPPAPPNSESKFTKIMTCLFWKKKTDVVDLKKEEQAAARKKTLTVDRSERSRRVLKMESTREMPKERDESDTRRPNHASSKMFLPSESPTASFLSYLNPTVRRACSEVIRTNSSNGSVPNKREAFAETKSQTLTRNTNYRGGQTSLDRPPELPKRNHSTGNADKPPKLPVRSKSQVTSGSRKTVVVPGTMLSDDDIGYNSDNDDIYDIHDELQRMNLSNPDLRKHMKHKVRRREGSISLSEGSDDNEKIPEDNRPINPSPYQHAPTKVILSDGATPVHSASKRKESKPIKNDENPRDVKNYKGPKGKIMEEVIDALYLQTQNNIDSIYKNGLDNLELETYRPETATPDTCMKMYEQDLYTPKVDTGRESPQECSTAIKSSRAKVRNDSFNSRNCVTHRMNGDDLPKKDTADKQDSEESQMDSLLSEVSIWAKDRQNWLLEDSNLDGVIERDDTTLTQKTDDEAINNVMKTNSETCHDWIDSVNQVSDTKKLEPKVTGILTGPKLFRSSSRNSRKVSFNENDRNQKDVKQNKPLQLSSKQYYNEDLAVKDYDGDDSSMITKRNEALKDNSHLQNETIKRVSVDLTQRSLTVKPVDQSQIQNSIPEGNVEPWSHSMYNNQPKHEDDRSTLDDNLSELDHKVKYTARSPDSWLSSVGSFNGVSPGKDDKSHDDSFETISSHNADNLPNTSSANNNDYETLRISADQPGKSHQIVRNAPKVHSFSYKRDDPQIPNDTSFLPKGKQIIKNTQLRPLPAPGQPRFNDLGEIDGLNAFPSHAVMKGSTNNVMRGSRNMNIDEFEVMVASAPQPPTRPYSEIPLRASQPEAATMNDFAHNIGWPLAVQRPASETVPNKRSDKVGMGNIMATDTTKDRNRYARDIVNSIQRQKPVTTNPKAFTNDCPEPEKTPKKKRHTVFDNNLMKGGYDYDKHSRSRVNLHDDTAESPRDQTIAKHRPSVETSPFSPRKNENLENAHPSQRNRQNLEKHKSIANINLESDAKESSSDQKSPRAHKSPRDKRRVESMFLVEGNKPAFKNATVNRDDVGASVSELTLNMRDSAEFKGRTTKLNGYGINKTFNIVPERSASMKNQNKNKPHLTKSKSQSKADTYVNSQSNQNIDVPHSGLYIGTGHTTMQSHGANEMAGNDSGGGVSQTAQRFKTLRSQRDKDINWLMRDAAETEV